MDVIGRSEAKRLGLIRYFTGKPCKDNHISERLASNGCCLECSRERSTARYRENRSEILRVEKIRRAANPDRQAEYRRRARCKADPDLPSRLESKRKAKEMRDEARRLGEVYFNTGEPCKNGHLSDRYTNDGKCVICTIDVNRKKRGVKSYDDAVEYLGKELDKVISAARSELASDRKVWSRLSAQSRRVALERRDKTYFSHRPCPNGHVGNRYTSSGSCVKCFTDIMKTDERKEYDKQYYMENRERIAVRGKQYVSQNRDKVRESSARWKSKNPDKVRAIKSSYKARRRSWEADDSDPTALVSEWVESQDKSCFYCKSDCTDEYHIDHFLPLSKGGKHKVDNLVIACPSCNLRKNAKYPWDFMQEIADEITT